MGSVKGGPTGSTLGLTLGGKTRCRCCMKRTFYYKEINEACLCKDCRPHWDLPWGMCPLIKEKKSE